MLEKKGPDDASIAREMAIKNLYILEHNAKGQECRDGKITQGEWKIFQAKWKSRFKLELHNAVKERVYKTISMSM